MPIRTLSRRAPAILFLMAGTAMTAFGCSLLVSFDESKIPTGDAGLDGGGPDSKPPVDGSADGDAGCGSPADCPKPSSECVSATCTSGVCGTSNAVSGFACTTGGTVCDGAGHCVGCALATDCASQPTVCKVNACASNTCTSNPASAGTACTDNGGKLCDGSGACVACNATSDCPTPTTVCKIAGCTGHACGTTNAAKGTACTDGGGVVCDGNGACVATHCTDGAKDADETDVDCGGSCGASCKDTSPQQHCAGAGDCVSGVCAGTLCQPPTCTDSVKNGSETDKDCGGGACPACADTLHCAANADCANNLCSGSGPGTCVSCGDGVKNGNETDKDCGGAVCDALGKTCATGLACAAAGDCASGVCQGNVCVLRPDGQACASNGQCAHGSCVSGICCNSACNGTCQACALALTGVASGTCGSITAGTTAPAGQCAVSTTCGNDGKCGAGGACEQSPSTVTCGTASCASGQLTTAATCSGTGTCGSGATSACPGGFKCASATACLTACASDVDCQASTTYCAAGACVAKVAAGATCAGANQCTSGICGVGGSGHCCASACAGVGTTCGPTDCSVTGACSFAAAGIACTASSCSGFTLTTFTTCDGSGTCGGSPTPAPCAGNLVCNPAGTACLAGCGNGAAGSDASCQTGHFCDGVGSGACQAKLAPSAACTRNAQCVSGLCQGDNTCQ